MNKYTSALIAGLILSLQPLHAGGPWLVYKAVIDGEGGIIPLNLAYDNGPQFASTEQDPDEQVFIDYNPRNKTIWKTTYDGDNTSSFSTQNEWHRLSWGRDGNKFGLLYSQYEVVGSQGTADHGVFFLQQAPALLGRTGGKVSESRANTLRPSNFKYSGSMGFGMALHWVLHPAS